MRVEVVARGVSPDDAWAWWTDFREGPGDHAFAAWAHPQRQVARQGQDLVLTEDARVLWLRYHEVVRVQLAKPRLRFDAVNNFGRFRGHYRFLPAQDGTRIEVAWDQELVRWLRWLGPLGRFGVKRLYAWDLKQHVRAMEREAAGPQRS